MVNIIRKGNAMQQDMSDLEFNAQLQVMGEFLRLLPPQEQMEFLAKFLKELSEFAKRAEQDKKEE
jgi:hypothetical protein